MCVYWGSTSTLTSDSLGSTGPTDRGKCTSRLCAHALSLWCSCDATTIVWCAFLVSGLTVLPACVLTTEAEEVPAGTFYCVDDVIQERVLTVWSVYGYLSGIDFDFDIGPAEGTETTARGKYT